VFALYPRITVTGGYAESVQLLKNRDGELAGEAEPVAKFTHQQTLILSKVTPDKRNNI
jgi:hypothetical protein